MAGKGGRREGAGRKPGSHSPKVKETRDLLNNNRVLILQKAISLATADTPNIAVLLKLLDKILPTLTMAEFEGMLKTDAFAELTDQQFETLVTKFSKYADTYEKKKK